MSKDQESNLEASSSTNTPLTPNSNAVIVPSGDVNEDTQIAFQYDNMISYWSPMVSSALTTAILSQDVGNGIVTFMQGLTVQFLPLSGGYYTVTVTGQIKDSGSVYNIVGKSLGTFPMQSAQ